MQKRLIVLLIPMLFLVSCSISKKMILDEPSLNDNISFLVEDNILKIEKEDSIYKISNLEKFCQKKDFWYAFFNLDNEKQTQLLVVCDIATKSINHCKFYPQTSHFFDDDLICFSIRVEPQQFPLPQLYEIKTVVTDFNNSIEKEDIEYSRFWTSMKDNVQDFYYREPVFLILNNNEIPSNILSAIDRKYVSEDKVFIVLWEQAHFPLSGTYYYKNKKQLGCTSAYPDLNDSEQYRTENEELKVIKTKDEKRKNDKYVLFSHNIDNYVFSISKNNKETSDYKDYEIILFDGQKEKKYNLDKIFKYQDPLVGIELAEEKKGYACFIITTTIFSYDVYIDLISGEPDIYLRASSFPNENRSLE